MGIVAIIVFFFPLNNSWLMETLTYRWTSTKKELGTGHLRRPGEGCSLAFTSQTFMKNCSVPGTVLVTGDTEMNRTHCLLIHAPPCPPLSLSGHNPRTLHVAEGWGHEGQNHGGRDMAWQPEGQKTQVIVCTYRLRDMRSVWHQFPTVAWEVGQDGTFGLDHSDR
jgi:hypothetical protein